MFLIILEKLILCNMFIVKVYVYKLYFYGIILFKVILMGKIVYLLKRILKLDYKNMVKIAKAVSKKTKRSFIFIFIDMIRCGFVYQAGYYDYQEFEFYILNKTERQTFLTRGKNNEIIKRFNNRNSFYKFEDKSIFNSLFNQFLKRNWMVLDGENIAEFKEFVKNNKVIVVKPLDAEGGEGIEKFVYDPNRNYAELYEELMANKQVLIEEWIQQHPNLNKLYDKSVNTMRMFTFYKDGKSYFLQGLLKIGNGAVADNIARRRYVYLCK